MSNIMVINGNELMVKEYNGQRVVTLWDVARLHNSTVNKVRMNFENNKEYLTEGEDYFVVAKQDALVNNLIVNKEVDYHAINRTQTIPLFTESGYLMMVKPMTGKIAWAVQKQLIRTYFAMKQVKEMVKTQLDANAALETSKFLISLADAVGVSPEAKLIATKNIYRLANIDLPFEITLEQKLYDLDVIAKRVGLFSANGIPHAQATSAVIKQLNVPDSMKVVTFEAKGNWQGSVVKFKEDIIDMVRKWLQDNNYPAIIKGEKKTYKVVYNIAM